MSDILTEALRISNEEYGKRSKKPFEQLSEIQRLRCAVERLCINYGYAYGYYGYKSAASAKNAWGTRPGLTKSLWYSSTPTAGEAGEWKNWIYTNFPSCVKKDQSNAYNPKKYDLVNIPELRVAVANKLIEVSRGLPEGLI